MAIRKRWFALLVPAVAASVRAWKQRSRGSLAVNKGEGNRLPSTSVPDPAATATERYLLYCMIPLWVLTGLLDYTCHRRTSIQTTSGTTESLIHALMMTEAGLPMVLGLFLK